VALEQAVDPGTTTDELVAQLAHELSLLVRSELEVAAAERRPWLQHIAVELTATAAAVVTSVLTLIVASLAAVAGLRLLMPDAIAALVVAVIWGVVTALLLSVDHPRRLWKRYRQPHDEAIAAAQADRANAEAAVRRVAKRLSRALSAELRAREAHALIAGEKRLVAAGERDVEVVLKELLSLLTAPGRLGVSLLERLLEGNAAKRDGG
jgi:Putative Actinobacterial Holin-X, holin superfamily III